MSPNELPPVNLRPLSPVERDSILFQVCYRDPTRNALLFLKMMDARDHAIIFIQKCGLLDAYMRYCDERNKIAASAGQFSTSTNC